MSMNPATLPMDPQAAAFVALVRETGYPPLEALVPAQARRAYAASVRALDLAGEPVALVQNLTIPGPGGPLTLRIYRGQGATVGERLPGVLFLHGGGWVIGDLESHDSLCRRLANGARVVVVAVDYRLAPEHPFPAALDDAAAALRWLAANAHAWDMDPAALGVAGDSAGGNLAAALALMARPEMEGGLGLPALAMQALFYPVTDLGADAPSYQTAGVDLPLSAATMHYFRGHYTPRPADRLDWRASPLRAPSLAGAAPALVLTVGHDPLCDEGRAYAQRLSDAGVRVTAVHCNDQLHGLLGLGRQISAARTLGEQLFALMGHELHRSARQARLSTEEKVPTQEPAQAFKLDPITPPAPLALPTPKETT